MMYTPFSYQISPMKRLFLINFEKDPDEFYLGFEPQWFDDTTYGKGLRVIAWRRDGFIDVYQQPSLKIEESIDVAGKGLKDTFVVDMMDSRFNISSKGVDVAFEFVDSLGRTVKVVIVEKRGIIKNPFSLLAPVGSSSEKPASLPLYFLFEFDFVRRKQTEVDIEIDGRQHSADGFPFLLKGHRVYFMRYSADTFLVDWCPQGSMCLEKTNRFYETIDHLGISKITEKVGEHSFNAAFNPPFPDVCQMEESDCKGSFSLYADEGAGSVSGTYEVKRMGNEVSIFMVPSEGWRPEPKTWFLKLLFSVAKVFKHWPKTYMWRAQITLVDEGAPQMTSKWERIR